MKQVEGFHVVPVGPDGYPAPDLASPPAKVQVGDIYLTPSSERTAYTEWIRAGADWVQVGETQTDLSEVDMLKKQRVNSVRDYFRKKKEEYKKRKRYEAATELVNFFEEHKADPDLHSVVNQLWEDMK